MNLFDSKRSPTKAATETTNNNYSQTPETETQGATNQLVETENDIQTLVIEWVKCPSELKHQTNQKQALKACEDIKSLAYEEYGMLFYLLKNEPEIIKEIVNDNGGLSDIKVTRE